MGFPQDNDSSHDSRENKADESKIDSRVYSGSESEESEDSAASEADTLAAAPVVAAAPQRVPLVALVGRPNVGKSTLFNRFVGRPMSIVHDQPGVTRDRIFGEANISGRLLRIVDTGGLSLDNSDTMLSAMRQQTQLAIDEADLVLLVVDAASGLHPEDKEVARLLFKGGKPTVVVANKIDDPKHSDRVHDMYSLGLDTVIAVSAEHGRGYGDLCDVIVERLNPPSVVEAEDPTGPIAVAQDDPADPTPSRVEWKGGPIRVAVIGRPNAGKSSLINCILGEERLLATPIAGTTRDAVDTEYERENQKYLFIDTAGVRRKRSIASKLEQFAVVRAFQSIDRADVVLLVLDSTERPSEQDARIAGMVTEKGKALIIVANKWDLIENPEWREKYPEAIVHSMPFATYAPILRLSAKTGRGLSKLFLAMVSAQQERHRRVGTGELNRFFGEVVEAKPPPIHGGKRPKLFFVSQPMVRPPTFVFMASHADGIHFSYQRYLTNALRSRYGFEGTPIWIKFRARSKKKKEF